ncbi:ABC transporter ATP-binding protein [Actinobacillus equuli subsp. haemolyticus]|uniref:ABC transporter ATP-binding protein n=1 Tax=Actinobacillus equuli TaxID=718 RepID=UPI002418A624|nr:ABC transporter ATP-binding protein [Actinobacillus equuli]MDG4947810.1 ABC transporter ATP-binding protein [Actinobacillus equuli subsp. haemolyticus]
MSVLTIKNLNLCFGHSNVLHQLNLEVGQNEIICLLGASGCGKTTLLKAIAGLLPIEQGEIYLAGKNLQNTAVEHRKIGLIFQDYALFPHLTVEDNIRFGLSQLSNEAQNEVVKSMLSVVKLEGLEQRFPHQLSGGQQQRVAIARALACKPELLLLDEPFSNIDSQTRYAMIQEIKQILKSQNVPAIFVTHSKEEAFAFADKIAVMDGGKIVQFGSATTLYHAPANPFVADFLGGTNYLQSTLHQDKSLDSPIGTFKIFPETELNAGKYLWLLRPEQLLLKSNATGQGKIVGKLFLGLYYRYQIAINGVELTAYQNQEFKLGEVIEVGFQIREFVLFPI